jgi:hypothetical protein
MQGAGFSLAQEALVNALVDSAKRFKTESFVDDVFGVNTFVESDIY